MLKPLQWDDLDNVIQYSLEITIIYNMTQIEYIHKYNKENWIA